MRSFSIHILVVVLAAAGSGCTMAQMDPGESCGRCHGGSGHGKAFGAAGTVYSSLMDGKRNGLADATIAITDADGKSVSMASNEVGNFYTTEALTPPLAVTVSRAGAARVSGTAPSGDCNSCHTNGSSPGRLSIP